MKIKAYITMMFGIGLALMVLGCAAPMGAGRYKAMSLGEQKRTLAELEKNWSSYDIYSDGAVGPTAAVIFDPRDNDRKLTGNGYIQLEDEKSVNLAIQTIQGYHQYDPRLYEITGDDGRFYGYVFLAYYLPVPSRVDERTLSLPRYKSPVYFGR
jgi:hypothetical protein